MFMGKTNCHTYFAIRGEDFDPNEIASMLGLKAEKSWKRGDLRRDGKPYGFAYLEICHCGEYDPYTDNQLKKTIAPLLGKEELLLKLAKQYGLEYYLEAVPSLYLDEIHPALAPSIEVMEWCVKTKTKFDIDLYLYPNVEEA